jgi:C_GCAxxG_C_C family probable redox protein
MSKSKELKAEEFFLEGYACSQAVLMAFADEIGLDMETAKKVSSTFGGGMGRMRKTCGALTGAFMVIGIKYGNTKPDDMETKLNSYDIVQELAKKFKAKHGTTNCAKLLKKYTTPDAVENRNHHKIICSKLVKDATNMLEHIFMLYLKRL